MISMHTRKKRVLIATLCIVLGSVVVVSAWYFLHKTSAENKNAAKITSVQTDSKAKTTATIPQLRLPGAEPIDARIEDYHLPTSLWTVVSKDYPLTEQQYRPTDLTLTDLPARSDKTSDEKSIRKVVVPDLTALFQDAKTAGNDIMIASGFRSYELQQTYFSSYSRSYGVEAANKFSALPGQSEHQTGLSLDIAYTNRDCYLDVCFGEKPAGQWLAANAYKYGFVLRYSADKTAITKYQYEPWHFRYVGKPLAKVLHESGLTLDEARPYLEKTRAELLAQRKI